MKQQTPLRRFLDFLRPYLLGLVGLCLLVLLLRLAALPAPMIYRAIVDEAIPQSDAQLLAKLIVGLAAILLFGRLLSFFMQIAATRLQQSVLHDVRMALYAHLQQLDLGFFRRHASGGLLSRIMSDVSRVQAVLSRESFDIFAALIQVVVVGGLLLWLNPRLALISALVFPILVALVALFQKKIYTISKVMQERREDLSARIQENLAGTRLIQALAIEPQRLRSTGETSGRLRDTMVRAEVIGSGVTVLTFVLTDMPLSLFVWGYGGYLVIQEQMSLGSLLAFYQYLMMLYDPVIKIFRFNIQLQTARAAVDRVYEVLDTPPAVVDNPDAKALTVERGAVHFHNVTIGYEEDAPPAIKDLELTIKPGEVLGIVGPSGAGKTTVVNGLMRFLSPQKGRITIDGQDLEEVTLSSLRSQIGLVAQDVFLFSDSLRNNIALARPQASQEDIVSAARAAQAHDFIAQLEQGYETEVGERGVGLSGGERQRMTLARVILQDPPILILDEAMSAVDPQSEELIRSALEHLVKDRTTIIIAHRFSTLKLCQRIAVISGGQLVELGTHDELSAKGGLYQALLTAQLLDTTQ